MMNVQKPQNKMFPFVKKRFVLGLTKAQMAMVYLIGVFTYLVCTFFIPVTHSPFWSDLTWKDMLALFSIIISWTAFFIFNKVHPDEDIMLNLLDDEEQGKSEE